MSSRQSERTIADTFISGLAGTTAMTVFSYLVSQKQGKYFKEPEILNDLLYRLLKVRRDRRRGAPGFAAHYTTGSLFSLIYNLFPKKKSPLEELGKGLLFGLAFGLIGIGVWKAVFRLHPNPPSVHVREFVGHLIVAHLVFGETVAATSALLRGRPHGLNGSHYGAHIESSLEGDAGVLAGSEMDEETANAANDV